MGECPPRPPRTALRQRAVERHVGTRSAKRLQTHRFKLTASRRFKHEAFSFPRCARKFPHEPRKRRVLRCLGLPSAATLTKARREKCIVVILTGYATGSCEKNMVPHKSLALLTACGSKSFLEAKAAPAATICVAREGIFTPAAHGRGKNEPSHVFETP